MDAASPKWDQLVPIPYVPDTKERIIFLTSLLDIKNPKYEKCHQANIKAAIGFYETGFDGIATIYIVDGRKVNSLKEALLNKEPVWIEVGAMQSLLFECVLTAGIGWTAPPISSEGDISVESNPSLPRGEL